MKARRKLNQPPLSGALYEPWIKVRSFSSVGFSTRVESTKCGRTHHFLSWHEWRYFLVLEWSEKVVDIREQYPLFPDTRTRELARVLGVEYPKSRDYVVTTDFVVDIRVGEDHYLIARAVKPTSELVKQRVLELLEIERAYWEEQSVDWGIVTDADIPIQLCENLAEFRGWANLPFELSSEVVDYVRGEISSRKGIALSELTSACDRHLGIAEGSSLGVVKHLIAAKALRVDLTIPFDPSKPLQIKEHSNDAGTERLG